MGCTRHQNARGTVRNTRHTGGKLQGCIDHTGYDLLGSPLEDNMLDSGDVDAQACSAFMAAEHMISERKPLPSTEQKYLQRFLVLLRALALQAQFALHAIFVHRDVYR